MASARIWFCTCCFVFIHIYLFILCGIVIPLQKSIYFCTLFHFHQSRFLLDAFCTINSKSLSSRVSLCSLLGPLRRFPRSGRAGAAGGRRGRARCHVTGARWPRSRGEAPGTACAPRGGLGGLRVPHGWVRAAVMLGDPRSRGAKAGAATAVPEGKVRSLSARGVGAVRPEGTGTPAGAAGALPWELSPALPWELCPALQSETPEGTDPIQRPRRYTEPGRRHSPAAGRSRSYEPGRGATAAGLPLFPLQ